MKKVIANCSGVAACKSLLAIHVATEARDCCLVVVVGVTRLIPC